MTPQGYGAGPEPALAVEDLRRFAGAVCRVQMRLLNAVRGTVNLRESDLPGWSIEIYDRVKEAILSHVAAVEDLVHDDGDDPARFETWIDEAEDTLARMLKSLDLPGGET